MQGSESIAEHPALRPCAAFALSTLCEWLCWEKKYLHVDQMSTAWPFLETLPEYPARHSGR